jgi:glycosyltransferase involved in cell wall biosynthesis
MVIIVPKMFHWRDVLSTGDIFLQPFVSKSFNPFLLEAMSLGSAVAACKGGVDDLIIEGETSLTFDCQDELSIRRTLQKLLNSRDFSRKLATEARDYISKNHSVTNMVTATVTQYRQAIEWYNK